MMKPESVRAAAFAARVSARHLAAERAFHGGERDLPPRRPGRSWWAPRPSPVLPVEIDILLQRAVDQARGAEVQHDAVGLDDAGVFFGVHGAQAAPDHLDHGGLVGTDGRSSTTQEVGG